ncbi:hypothetical protein ZIOFF_037213 [Zingiber officinale]|uniref:Uncharacterized protein n=1 Tax=Zingiber officinale TaxID=94328 RepID=A0A8J5L908_ZINOF|nr:hypothetical protein ZIOFF_037213 [Zingiber officinale]
MDEILNDAVLAATPLWIPRPDFQVFSLFATPSPRFIHDATLPLLAAVLTVTFPSSPWLFLMVLPFSLRPKPMTTRLLLYKWFPVSSTPTDGSHPTVGTPTEEVPICTAPHTAPNSLLPRASPRDAPPSSLLASPRTAAGLSSLPSHNRVFFLPSRELPEAAGLSSSRGQHSGDPFPSHEHRGA